MEARAQEYRRAGARRYIDILRVAAYLDILNGVPRESRIARFNAEDAADQDAAAGRDPAAPAPGDRSASGSSGGDDRDRGESRSDAPGAGASGDPSPCAGTADSGATDSGVNADGGGPGGQRPGGDRPGSGDPAPGEHAAGSRAIPDRCGESTADPGPAFAARANLTLPALDIPLLSALGFAQRPGEARGLGALDADLARKLAEAAARDPRSQFCVTIVNADGQAIGHGCGKPRRTTKGKAPPGTGTSPLASGAGDGFTIAPNGMPGPVGGFGSWLLTLPGRAGELVVDLHPVPTGDCDHRYESPGHDPGDRLRHLIHVRDGTCGFPTCGRQARESDFEHGVPFDEGGRTCGCNGWACSRSCHQLKQSDDWAVTQPKPGWIQWTTPSGRVFTREPWRYPA